MVIGHHFALFTIQFDFRNITQNKLHWDNVFLQYYSFFQKNF